jgi:alpha-tubulin suppressor-like RCC1 family protein
MRLPRCAPSASSARFSRFFPAAATLLAIACTTTEPAVPTQLAFTVQPGPTSAGAAINPPVTVAVQDASGNTILNATNSITLAIGTGSGSLLGTTTVAAVNGVATFTNLRINNAGTGYTLSAASPNLTGATSNPFAVVAGPANQLVFTVQPGPTTAGATITPAVAVEVQDVLGNTVTTATHTITLWLGPGSANASLLGTTSVGAVNGVATFSNLSINNAGTGYTLHATASNLPEATSSSFAVVAGPPVKLGFIVQPLTALPGATITPAVAVAVQDLAGNTITSATNSITVAIGTNAGSGTLSGTTTVAAVNGVATFSNLSIDNAGTGYTLTAAATNLTSGTSIAFSIRAALALAMVTAGYFHSCGLATGGVAHCWGLNGSGQVGAHVGPLSPVPIPVSGGLTFATLSAGRDHTCGVSPSGGAYCWGWNGVGQLGDGTTNQRTAPGAIAGGLTFASVIAGYSHTCGVTTGGAGYCWGSGLNGELGNATLAQSNLPVAVSGGLTFASISPGRDFSCGMTTAGVAYCWGVNGNGELGDGTQASRNVPVPVSGQLNFALVSAGGFHACGLTTGGLAYCWGWNSFGQLGDGTLIQRTGPVLVSGQLTFATLSVGNRHTCGVTTAGLAYCWGDNSSGHLGNGTTTNSSTPVPVAGGLTFTTVSAGRFHSCGVTTGGAGYCWGNNLLGDGTTESSLVPVLVR